jgi:hypothetical protein
MSPVHPLKTVTYVTGPYKGGLGGISQLHHSNTQNHDQNLWERLSSRDQSFRNPQQKHIPEPKYQILRFQVSEFSNSNFAIRNSKLPPHAPCSLPNLWERLSSRDKGMDLYPNTVIPESVADGYPESRFVFSSFPYAPGP